MTVTIDLAKAKTIGHTLRRAKREAAFAPYDQLIAKQIPGTDAVAAEEARVSIRAHYAVMQDDIDAATSPEEITNALGLEWDSAFS